MINWTERAKATLSQTGQGSTAKADETAISRLLAVSAVPTVAVSITSERLPSVLAVPLPAVLEKHDSAIGVPQDPDRWCWPHSSAMNGVEIDTFAARLARFTYKGLTRNDGETLADKLLVRDREQEDRRVCLECRHFSGHGAASWRCGNLQAAGIPLGPHEAQLPADLVVKLQRCDGFTAHLTSTRQETEDEHAPL